MHKHRSRLRQLEHLLAASWSRLRPQVLDYHKNQSVRRLAAVRHSFHPNHKTIRFGSMWV